MVIETSSTLHYVRSDASPSDEVDMQQAAELLDSGQLNGNSFVWTEGMAEWAKLSDCVSLFALSLDCMKLHYETSTSLPSELVTVSQLKELLRSGIVGSSTLVWAEGMDEWSRLGDCHTFFGLPKTAILNGGTAAAAGQQQAGVPPQGGNSHTGMLTTSEATEQAIADRKKKTGSSGDPSPEPEAGPWMKQAAVSEPLAQMDGGATRRLVCCKAWSQH
jgi:hypothetical protein